MVNELVVCGGMAKSNSRNRADEYLTSGEAGRILGVTDAMVVHISNAGDLLCIFTANGKRLYRREDVEMCTAIRRAKLER